jgi:aminopeptidase N
MRDNFAMDGARHDDQFESKKSFIKLSRTGFFLFLAIFLCSLVAVALLVSNFSVCSQEDPQLSENHYHIMDPSFTKSLPHEEIDQAVPSLGELRLPSSIKPFSYDVKLLPFLSTENFTFNGEIDIKIQVKEICKNITLHTYLLQIIWSSSQDSSGETLESVSIHSQYFVEDKQFLILEMAKELEPDFFYLVKLSYVGSIKDNLQGFYKSSYNVGSETRWIASTQFQATDARR